MPGWWVALLVLAWLMPGLVGHDPWKPDEAYSMGLVLHILETGDWIVPTLGGEPFMEKPPLYYLTAAAVARLFSPVLPLHDGARLASGLYMAIVFFCVARTGRILYGRGQGRLSLLLLMGCLGLLPPAHQMITDTALLAGFAIALLGLALARQKPLPGGLLLGLGSGVGFMAKGLLAPLMLGLTVLLLLCFSSWRNRRFVGALAIALLTALPWLILWPYVLYHKCPPLFDVWFWENNYGRFFGSSGLATRQEPGHYLKALTWFSGPAIPLALLALWQFWRQRKVAAMAVASPSSLLLPLVMAGVVLLTLFASTATRALYILPLLLPVSLLATPIVADGPPPPGRFWVPLLLLLFGIPALFLWSVWLLAISDRLPEDLWLVSELARSLPFPAAGEIPFQWPAVTAALLATGAWLFGMPRSGRSVPRLLTTWTGGVTLLWLLSMTLWLPLIDHGKSYRSMVLSLQQALPHSTGCIASRHLGEPQRAMLHYYAHIFTQRTETTLPPQTCDWLLIQNSSAEVVDPPDNGQLIWQGRRPGDTKEWYFLYRLTAFTQ